MAVTSHVASIEDRQMAYQAVGQPAGAVTNRRAEAKHDFWILILLGIGHIALGLLSVSLPILATIHVFATLAGAILIALTTSQFSRVLYCAAYISANEVFWRMQNTPTPWELGKYSIILLMGLWLLRTRARAIPAIPVFYLLLLLPAIIITFAEVSPDRARKVASQALAGPALISISTLVCLRGVDAAFRLPRFFAILLAPFLGIGTIVLYKIVTATEIVFTGESNFATSAGYGPNQVSILLGFAAMAFCLQAILQRQPLIPKLIQIGLAVGFAAQSAFTFSRGGLYCAIGGIVAFLLANARSPRHALQTISMVGVVVAIFLSVVFPAMDKFSGNALSKRFASTDPTNRSVIINEEIKLWMKNPMFGIGAGRVNDTHTIGGEATAAHTEGSRVLAEHGMLGLLALMLLAIQLCKNILSAKAGPSRALVLGLLVWATLTTMTAATRLSLPCLIIGITALPIFRRLDDTT